MKKILACLLFMFLTAALLFKAAPEAAAYEPGDPYSPDLSELRNIITELVDRNAGPTEFKQYNSYYSPKDLSPAECARKTRDETRQLLKNVKRA